MIFSFLVADLVAKAVVQGTTDTRLEQRTIFPKVSKALWSLSKRHFPDEKKEGAKEDKIERQYFCI